MLIRIIRYCIKFFQFGPRWAYRRIVDEFRYPTSPISRIMRRSQLKIMGRSDFNDEISDVLFFPYDLSLYPITFDFVSYLAAAEMQRRRLGLSGIAVVIVPGPRDMGRIEDPGYDAVVDSSERKWRIDNILVPVASMLPSVRSFMLAKSRDEVKRLYLHRFKHSYPKDYEIDLPTQALSREICDNAKAGEIVFPMYLAPSHALRLIKTLLNRAADDKYVLVISLRSYNFRAKRNSDLSVWSSFASGIDKSVFHIVVVPDINDIDPVGFTMDGVTMFAPAVFNLQLRTALYEMADLVMGVSQGPMELCWLNHRCKYIVFLKTDSTAENSKAALAQHGFDFGCPPSYASEDQIWNWGTDALDNVTMEFEIIKPKITSEKPRHTRN